MCMYHCSLQEECGESVCGVQLTEVNMQICNTLPRLVASFSTADSYLSLLARGQSTIRNVYTDTHVNHLCILLQ